MRRLPPRLLQQIKADFQKAVVADSEIKRLNDLLLKKQSDYECSEKFAIEVGELLAESINKNVSSDVLPNGKMYYNIANRLLNSTLSDSHAIVSEYAAETQTVLNQEAQLGIKGIKSKLNQDRIDGLVEYISKATKYDDISVGHVDSIVSFHQAIVVDTLKENAEFHYQSGLQPKIVRRYFGGCNWCKQLAGTYNYPDEVPHDVYRRHNNCRCIVEYFPRDGKKQDVWSKKVNKVTRKDERILTRSDLKEIRKGNRIQNIAYSKALELGYNPLPPDRVVEVLRKDSNEWIKLLTPEEMNAITKYTYNGVDKDGLRLFEKINGILGGYYIPIDEREKEMLLRYYGFIENALMKNTLKNDIITYRNDHNPSELTGTVNKFLSTSVTQKGVLGQNPNVAIFVSKNSNGAYVEGLSHRKFKRQREFILNYGEKLDFIKQESGIYLYRME